MYRIPSVAVFVEETSRRALAYFCDFPMSDGDVLFTSDGTLYRPVKHHGIFGTHTQHDIRATIPDDGQGEILLRRRGNVVTYGAERYLQRHDLVVDMADMVGMPQRRKPEYLLRTPNGGTFVFVSVGASGEDSDETYRVFTGSGKHMWRVDIKPNGVTRTSDGKLVILTAERALFVLPPSAVQPGTPLVPGWGEAELTHARLDDYIITEWLCGDVTIEKKRPQ